METTVTFEYGPMTVEIHALNDEDYQEEVLDLMQFIENNQDQFNEFGVDQVSPEIESDKTESTSLESFAQNGVEEENTEPGPLHSIASQLHVSESQLERFLHVNPDDDEMPVLYSEELGKIGKRQTDRQRVASLILLYVWHECYEANRVKSSKLKDALELSSISSSGMANMYQGEGDRYFNRAGRGPSATVKLTPPGKRQARKILRKFTQKDGGEN
ncbi:hypothetical protein DEQ92_04450 [Haloferax sp. Atlit-6N]|uniref:hypothetical protein n=1 Tax=Haloferax TaxID=2251 RepID=UPI0009D9E269|nr:MULTISPECIES: hypothetical protein [Haloferax]REA05535.1 hypothetical protein DEQ92_04450 [Haloferax sp. Atlit-6N]